MKGYGGVSRCGLRDGESSRDLMQRSSAGRLQARSRLERVSRGEDGRRMGWSLALGIGIAKDVGCEAWLFVMGFVSFANCYAMWFLALDA